MLLHTKEIKYIHTRSAHLLCYTGMHPLIAPSLPYCLSSCAPAPQPMSFFLSGSLGFVKVTHSLKLQQNSSECNSPQSVFKSSFLGHLGASEGEMGCGVQAQAAKRDS